MRIAPGTPLNVSLHWDTRDIQPVGRLAYRDQVAYLEYEQTFLKTGLELSPAHHKTVAGLQRPYDTDVFEGLHGMFNDSLPDGWGRLLVDRRARQLGIEPSTLTSFPFNVTVIGYYQSVTSNCYMCCIPSFNNLHT